MITGFKEWKSVCDTLERGDQTLILRKGGIAEGKEGFLWQNSEFFLFPTAHHDHRNQLKNGAEIHPYSFAKRNDGQIEIRLRAQIVWSADLDSLDTASKLDPFHIWKAEVIEQRFDFSKNKGIRLALLRVHKLKTPWILKDNSSFGGCRSWLELPDPTPEQQQATPVLNDADFSRQKNQLEEILAAESVNITIFDQ